MTHLFNKTILCLSAGTMLFSSCGDKSAREETFKRPNILIAISDDQSFPHASAYGSKMVNTPAFDHVAAEGILFNNAFVASPGCAPSRAALLTGLNTWKLEEAGTHASFFPAHLKVYTNLLEQAGYYVGYTQKGWAPVTGRQQVGKKTLLASGSMSMSWSLLPMVLSPLIMQPISGSFLMPVRLVSPFISGMEAQNPTGSMKKALDWHLANGLKTLKFQVICPTLTK